MAVFLLIYIIICIVWFFWAGILTYLILRYRYPDKTGITYLIIFWCFSAAIFLISIIFISRADWATLPQFFKSVSMTY
jgi:hypothetical protein